ncbi:MAG TPA: GNAT family N-acetyltransferase [Candidatus Eisenbacteria bacterium]|nr:GNAT family N-acetyltransferase [Candidatus Eisenbacteria bacterium]
MGEAGLTAGVERLADVAPAEWGGLSRCPSYYLTYDWMSVMAPALGSDLDAVLVRDRSGAPLLGAPLSTVTAGGDAAYDPLRVLARAGREAQHGEPRLQALAGCLDRSAGGLYPAVTVVAPGFVSGVCESPALGQAGADAAAATLLDGLEREARSRAAGAAAFLYLPEEPGCRVGRLAAGRGYRSAVVAARCVLEVAWPTFEDYLRSRTKTRRKSIRAEVDRFRAQFAVEVTGAEGLTDELVPLHARWRAKHGRPVPEAELSRQYASIRERLGPAVRVFIARREDRPAAFAQFYEHRGTLYSRAIGFDYDSVEGRFAYFNLLFYEPLRHAMAHGLRALDYSFESYEAKVGRGCALQHLLVLLKPLAPVGPWFDEYVRLTDRGRRAGFLRLRELHP